MNCARRIRHGDGRRNSAAAAKCCRAHPYRRMRDAPVYPEMTNTSIGHFRGGRGKPVYPGRLNRLPRAVGSASVPAGDRAALVGSAEPVIESLYSSASGPSVSCAGSALASSTIPRESNFSAISPRNARKHRIAPVRNGAANHNRRVAPRYPVSPNSCGLGNLRAAAARRWANAGTGPLLVLLILIPAWEVRPMLCRPPSKVISVVAL
jgi:hypothetical protein